jgi:nucleoside phosphorylase
MEISQLEEVLQKIQKMQSIMIAVATGEEQIQNLEEDYIQIFGEVDLDIELFQEENICSSNPNPFNSLWDWYNYWSCNFSNYADRRKYVYNLYTDLINTLEQSVQIKADRSGSKNINDPEKLNGLLVKIQELQSIMLNVATGSASIQSEEENYIKLYQEISSYSRKLQQEGLIRKDPNNFSSLWHWHSYWKSELDGYPSRRSFVRELYGSIVVPIQQSLRKHQQRSTSVQEFTEDLYRRFNEKLLKQTTLTNTDAKEVGKSASINDNLIVKSNKQALSKDFIVSADSQQSVAPSATEPMIDFAIITAIKVERLAVLKCFEIDEKEDRYSKDSRTYWRKRLRLKDGKFYEIVVAQSIDTANLNAALLANDMFHHWKPASIFMVGIAATAQSQSKQNLGDLVVGKEICYYEMGKITAEGKLPEPKQIPVDATLLNRIHALPDTSFLILADRPDGTKNHPRVEVGVIASGDKVISDSIERDKIAAANRKIMAIEMEGYGVIAAAWQSFEQVRCLVIRALCDYADGDKNDQWHVYSAAVAAGYARHFLLDEPLPPRNLPEISE